MVITKNLTPGYLMSGGAGVFEGALWGSRQECLVPRQQYVAAAAAPKHVRPTTVDFPTTGIPPAGERCP